MKYMGSKRSMLTNGLGVLLDQERHEAGRFFDLFAGSGAVSIHIARKYSIPVFAFDLQKYSSILANAVISRNREFDCGDVWQLWIRRAKSRFNKASVPTSDRLTQAVVYDFRKWCAAQADSPITKAYGGYYFSPKQAMWIDALLATLPERNPARIAALSALIQTASCCAAAPGHTAQPFQPTRTAKRYLVEAWSKDVIHNTKEILSEIAGQFAMITGKAEVGDANQVAKHLQEDDLVFLDPPYSGVHYSRFYHVIETIARSESGEVSGEGRYPAPELRPRSSYSVGTESAASMDDLLKTISSKGARAIMTFPDHDCSNGLSGELVRGIARKYFRITKTHVKSRFSTLGGTSDSERKGEGGRSARLHAKELMLVLKPK